VDFVDLERHYCEVRTDVNPTGIVAAMLESDRRYFEMAAHRQRVDGATLDWVPGLTHMAAGCVVHRVAPSAVPVPDRWLPHVEVTLRELGARWLRVYLHERHEELEAALAAGGCRPRAEVGYLGQPSAHPGDEVALVPVTDDAAWRDKLRLHDRSGVGSALYEAEAADWVELERRKCDAGAMRAFLATVNGAVCGTVSVIPAGQVLRAKNLLVDARFRGRGLARAMLARVYDEARRQGVDYLGAFAAESSAAERVYRRTGFRPVTRQYEWSRPL
jgi:GNAT superfamily N-acetyltransferase